MAIILRQHRTGEEASFSPVLPSSRRDPRLFPSDSAYFGSSSTIPRAFSLPSLGQKACHVM